MEEEQIKQKFRELFPEYTVKNSEVCLSPYIDIFEAGIEIATEATKELDFKRKAERKIFQGKVDELLEPIDKMKCVQNCEFGYDGQYKNNCHKDYSRECNKDCKNCKDWKLKE